MKETITKDEAAQLNEVGTFSRTIMDECTHTAMTCVICGQPTTVSNFICAVHYARLMTLLDRDAKGGFSPSTMNPNTLQCEVKPAPWGDNVYLAMVSPDPIKRPQSWDSYHHGSEESCLSYISQFVVDAQIRAISSTVLDEAKHKIKLANDVLREAHLDT